MKHIFLITLACISLSATCQQITKTIYFENDEYVLDKQDLAIISELTAFILDDLKEISSIEIYGFADSSASVNYNVELSKKRCEAVNASLKPALPLTQTKKININWYGELKPEYGNRELHYSQRCVDVIINYTEKKSTENISELFDQLREPAQKFRIDPTKDTILKGNAGTIIHIHANSFYIPKSCTGKDIDIILLESYDPASMFMNNLFTMSGQSQLESDGMIFLNAQVNDRILTVKEESPITIMFPTSEVKEEMDLFYGKKTEDGNIDWVVSTNTLAPVYNYEIVELLNRYHFYERKIGRECPFFFCGIKNIFSGSGTDNTKKYAYSSWNYKAYIKYRDSICAVYGVRSLYSLNRIMEERKMKNFESKIGNEEITSNEMNYYITKTSNLGWMNCDRFMMIPEIMKTNVIVQQQPADNISISLVFRKFKSMMGSNYANYQYYGFNGVPKRNKCYLVVLKYENKIPYMSLQEVTISNDLVIEPEFKQYTVEELKKELRRLNS